MRRKYQESEYLHDVSAKLRTAWSIVETAGVDGTPDLVVRGQSRTIYGLEWKAGTGPLHFNTAAAIEPWLEQIAHWRKTTDRDPILLFVTSQDFGERLLASVASLRFILIEYDPGQPPGTTVDTVVETLSVMELGQSDKTNIDPLCDPRSEFWRRRSRSRNVALHNAAIVSVMIEHFSRASELLAEVLETQVQTLGSDNPNVASTRISLAKILVRVGDREGARNLCQDALDTAERASGFGSSTRNVLVNAVADLLVESSVDGRLEVTDWQAAWNLNLSDALSSAVTERLGDLLIGRGRLEEAEHLYRRTLSLLDPTDPAAHTIEARLGDLLVERGRIDEAADLYRRMLNYLSPSSPAGGQITIRLADLLTRQGRTEQAEDLYRQMLNYLLPSDPAAGQITIRLADLLTRQGRTEEAEDLTRRIHTIE